MDPKHICYEDIAKALQERKFHLVYQPKHDMATNKVVGLEALLRWQYGEEPEACIMPSDFIPLAEETGIITEITLYVAEEACRFIRECRHAGMENVPVSINLSRTDLCNPFFIPLFIDVLEKHKVNCDDIEIEITETSFANAQDAILCQIRKLRQHGIRIAIDDFGTGYSSLAFLKDMPIDILKLDKTFLKDINIDKKAQGIIRSVLSLAGALGLSVVTEGVETKEEADYMLAQEFSVVQGYYFSRPIPKDEVFKMLCRSVG